MIYHCPICGKKAEECVGYLDFENVFACYECKITFQIDDSWKEMMDE